MAKRLHTIILIPHAHAKLRKWQVTNLQIGIAAGAFLALTLVAALFTWAHFHTTVNPVEITRLRHENERLRSTNEAFESGLKRIQEQLASYEDGTGQLAIVAGVESLESGAAEAGIGGGTAAEDVEVGDLTGIASRAGQIDDTLDAVEAKLNERVRWISSTPAITPV